MGGARVEGEPAQMGGNGSVVKGLGAVGGLASKLGHCGHGVRQRTLHTPGDRPSAAALHERGESSERRQIAGGGLKKK